MSDQDKVEPIVEISSTDVVSSEVTVTESEVTSSEPEVILSFDGVIKEKTDAEELFPDIESFLENLVEASKTTEVIDVSRTLEAAPTNSYFKKFLDRANKSKFVTRASGLTPSGKYSFMEGIMLDNQAETLQKDAIKNISRLSKALLQAVEEGHIVIQDPKPSFWQRCADSLVKRLWRRSL